MAIRIPPTYGYGYPYGGSYYGGGYYGGGYYGGWRGYGLRGYGWRAAVAAGVALMSAITRAPSLIALAQPSRRFSPSCGVPPRR